MDEQELEAISEILLGATARVLEAQDRKGVPVKALLAYEYIGENGIEAFHFVVSSTMGRLETIGHARYIESRMMIEINADDDE